MRRRRQYPCLFLILTLLFVSGCSYISTMDPNDNGRLDELKEESRREVMAQGSGMTLRAFQQKVEALKSPRMIFRTHIEGDELIVEAFTDTIDIQGALDSVFSGEELLDRVTLTNANRKKEDFLPDSFLPEDPDGMRFQVSKESAAGQLHDDASLILKTGSGNPAEKLYAQIRQLMLVGESIPGEAEGTFYSIRMFSAEGKILGELILDDGQTLHARDAEGASRTYLLMNVSQWSSLKSLLDVILSVEAEAEPHGDDPLGFSLPWMDPAALVAEASFIIESEQDPTRAIYLQAALVGRISPNAVDLALEEEFSGIWLVKLSESEGIYYPKDYSRIGEGEAAAHAGELGYDDEVTDLLSRLREQALYDFLIQAGNSRLLLDPDTIGR